MSRLCALISLVLLGLVVGGCGDDRSSRSTDGDDPEARASRALLEVQLAASKPASDSLLAQMNDGTGDIAPVHEHFVETLHTARKHPCEVVTHDDLEMTVRDAVAAEAETYGGWFHEEVANARRSLKTIRSCK